MNKVAYIANNNNDNLPFDSLEKNKNHIFLLFFKQKVCFSRLFMLLLHRKNGTGSPRSPFILCIIVTNHLANALCINKLCIGVRSNISIRK